MFRIIMGVLIMCKDLQQSLEQLIRKCVRNETRLNYLTEYHRAHKYYGWLLSSHTLEEEVERELNLRLLDYLRDDISKRRFESFDSHTSDFEDIDYEYQFKFICNNDQYSIIYYFHNEYPSKERFVKINIYKNDDFIDKVEFHIQDFVIEVVLSKMNHVLYGKGS